MAENWFNSHTEQTYTYQLWDGMNIMIHYMTILQSVNDLFQYFIFILFWLPFIWDFIWQKGQSAIRSSVLVYINIF